MTFIYPQRPLIPLQGEWQASGKLESEKSDGVEQDCLYRGHLCPDFRRVVRHCFLDNVSTYN